MAVFKFRNLKNGQATPVPEGEFTIGRAEDAYIHVDDSSVSRHHARLINNEEGSFLEDLGSANGVALHGAYFTGRSPIKLGDLVHIGKVPFRVDPEVTGEVSAELSSGLRQVDRTLLHRETERITAPSPGEATSAPAITYSDLPEAAESPRDPGKSGPLIRHSVPLPTLVKLMEPPKTLAETAASVASTATAEAVRHDPNTEDEVETERDSETMPWWWWTVVFLAGLGSGLLLGLFFAKLFLDLGGRASSLP